MKLNMINNFRTFENIKDFDYLIGIPSGQIIDIDYKMINNLKQEGLISYSKKYVGYIFDDKVYDNILFYLKRKVKRVDFIELDEIIDFFETQKHVDKYFILKDNSVDVFGSIYVESEDCKIFPIKFKNVSGDFIFKNCKLVTLENGPRIVKGHFVVSGNNLIDLIGGPVNVIKTYDCSNNKLITLNGCPPIIGGDLNCSNNKLTDFSNGPEIVRGFIDCTGNNLKKVLDYQPECFHLIGYGKSLSEFTKII